MTLAIHPSTTTEGKKNRVQTIIIRHEQESNGISSPPFLCSSPHLKPCVWLFALLMVVWLPLYLLFTFSSLPDPGLFIVSSRSRNRSPPMLQSIRPPRIQQIRQCLAVLHACYRRLARVLCLEHRPLAQLSAAALSYALLLLGGSAAGMGRLRRLSSLMVLGWWKLMRGRVGRLLSSVGGLL